MLTLALLLAAAQPATSAAPPRSFVPPVNQQAVKALPSGLRIERLAPGTGPSPTLSDMVLVLYEGHLADGTLFDASAKPVAFPVAGLIPGFTEALQHMQRGGRYRFWIPAALAYGAEGAGGGAIPPDAELEFIVTLIDFRPAEPAPAPQAPETPPEG
ncbi:MAG: FKBP-type peptidyl-prolyl cis-trans isomerase [Allosphingosinicella sp.]